MVIKGSDIFQLIEDLRSKHVLKYVIDPDTLIIPEGVLTAFGLCDACEIMGLRIVIIKCPPESNPMDLINFGYLTKNPRRNEN